jgi:SAM-dependent methyltransferase
LSSVREHYDNLLADVYVWMSGGFEPTRQRYALFFEEAQLAPRGTALAVDLGAGPGFQSLPLADLGYRVLALDTSQTLLDELSARKQQRDIAVVCDDMMNFPVHMSSLAQLIVCMTDTLLHLSSRAEVGKLFQQCIDALESGGKLVLTFRDLTRELQGADRFFRVRSDESRIFSCFLDYQPDHVLVHDLLYIRVDGDWRLSKSAYRKLRLAPDECVEWLRKSGFEIASHRVDHGMVTLIAHKP